jgi:hypothetical protein
MRSIYFLNNLILHPHCEPGVDRVSNRNAYEKSSWKKRWLARKPDNLAVICELPRR